MSDERPSLQSQISAVENVILSQKAWMERREIYLQKQGIKEDYGLQCTRMWFPALVAAFETLKGLREDANG